MPHSKADRRSQLLDAPERRNYAVSGLTIRKKTGDTVTLTGYATVFDAPYDVYGGAERGGWSEVIDPGAFDRTLAESPDLHLLINHEGMPLARTKSGTLRLASDATGLKVEADLDRNDPDVQRLETKMRRGDMDEMSFAFRVKAQQWSPDYDERRITEISLHKGDVSVVNFGANPATSANLRGILDCLASIGEGDAALAEARGIGTTELSRAHAQLGAIVERLRQPSAESRAATLSVAALRALGDGTEL